MRQGVREDWILREAQREQSYHFRDDPFAQIVVPEHSSLAKGTLRSIIRDADLDVEEFIALL
jgi:hypothetical protein